MDFSKTKLYQRTRSGYERLYLEYSQKKSGGRRRNGGGDNGGESGGDCVTDRVGGEVGKEKSSWKSSEVLEGSDGGMGRGGVNAVARRTRQAIRGKKKPERKKSEMVLTKGKDLGQVYLIEDSESDDDGLQNHVSSGIEVVSESEGVEEIKQSSLARNRGKNVCEQSLVDELIDDDGLQNHISSGIEVASESEEIAQSGPSSNRGKNVCEESLVDESDDDCERDYDGMELSKRYGKNQSKNNAKGISRTGKSKKDRRSLRTNDSQQNSDAAADDDALSYLGDGCKLSKSFGRNEGTSENDDPLKGKGGFDDEFDKNAKDSSMSSRGFPLSPGFRIDESDADDVEGITFLGDDPACLDDYDPSHSSRVESNEVKVSPVELESVQTDADAMVQEMKSSEEEDNDPQKLASPEEDGSEKNAAAQDKEVICLSSSDCEDGEKDENAMDDDGLGDKFFAKLLQHYKLDEGHIQENNDIKPNINKPKPVCEPKKKTEKVNEPVVGKKRCGSSNEMWKPVSKKGRTDADFSLGLSKNNDKGGEDTFWQIVDEKGPQMTEMNTSKKYDQSVNKTNVMKILRDAIKEEGGGDNLLDRYVDILPEDILVENTQVDQVLSYKFKFEDEEDIKPEKLESEIEMDGLFDEMNMCLQLSEIGFSDKRIKCGDAEILADGTDQATCCRRGKHVVTLNDEFGIVCRYCSYVEMEIRDLLPPLSKNGRGGHGRHDRDNTENRKFSDLKFSDCHQEHHQDSEGDEYEKGTVWDFVPGVKESLYPHQREGFEFIWNRIAGGIYIDKLEKQLSSVGSGCIISHAPGTGKSRLTIVFLQAFLKMYPSSRPLIVAPRSMLLTWEEEFKKWNSDFPFFNLNNSECSGKEHKIAVTLLKNCGSIKNTNGVRYLKLLSWKHTPSVLGITYRLFESLAGEEGKRKRLANNPEDDRIKDFLLKVPTLVVLDEGHTPRNDQSHMWKTLLNVKTKRSIILSGTPFQNNFDELYNTLCLVDPMLSYGISPLNGVDFSKKRGWKHNSAKGRWDSLTSSVRKSEDKLQELRAIIDPFVHVHKGTILQERLPGLRDALVVLRPTKTQKTLLERMHGSKMTLENDHIMSLVSVHPSLLPEGTAVGGLRKMLKVFENDPSAGVKTNFLMELINLSGAHNEKVLVFSQYIKPLEFIMQLLKTYFNWVEGRECLYMDGQKEEKQRQNSINTLNDPKSEVKVLLASLKACSEGISLVGASRVVLLDVHWNPSVERQAISRAYRLGQKKLVHVYHLVTGSMEGEKYIRQVEKSQLSELVFSSKDKDSSNPKISSTVSKDKILEEMVHHDKLRNMFEKVIYQPKEADLINTFG